MTARSLTTTLLVLGVTVLAAQQPPASVDTSTIGPQVGQPVPPFEGIDQFGKRQTLSSIAGPRGTMLVFFRSADW